MAMRPPVRSANANANAKWPRNVPIVALTATVDEQEKQACLEAGMDGHLGKPFSRDDLATVLAHHLGLPVYPAPQRAGLSVGGGGV